MQTLTAPAVDRVEAVCRLDDDPPVRPRERPQCSGRGDQPAEQRQRDAEKAGPPHQAIIVHAAYRRKRLSAGGPNAGPGISASDGTRPPA